MALRRRSQQAGPCDVTLVKPSCRILATAGSIARQFGPARLPRSVTSGVSLLTLPLAVRYLGAERYGVWATITTTAVWINLLDLGIANTLTNEISRAYALARQRSGRRYFTNALALTCARRRSGRAAASLWYFAMINWAGALQCRHKMSARGKWNRQSP